MNVNSIALLRGRTAASCLAVWAFVWLFLPGHPAQGADLTATLTQWGSNYTALVNFPAGIKDAKAIAAGPYHSLVVRTNGLIAGWGDPTYGRTQPPAWLNNVTAVAAGANHSVALRGDGTVVSWGDNSAYQTNTEAFTGGYAVAAGEYFTLSLRGDGRVEAAGSLPIGGTPLTDPLIRNVMAIACGPSYALGVVHTGVRGYVVTWGSSAPAVPVELGPAGVLNVVAVAAGYSHGVALLSSGEVRVWGNNSFGQLNPPTGVNNILGVSAHGNYTLARRNDGAAFAWGDLYGSVGIPTTLSNVVAIAAGNQHALALYWEPMTYLLQPQSTNVIEGQSATFAAAVTGSQPVTWQWRRNGTNLPAATNAVLTLSNIQSNQAGTYSVVVTNPVGNLTSTGATLTVLVPPKLVSWPSSQSVPQGSIVNFSVSVTGTAGFGYQWRKNGTNIAGAINPNYIIPNAQPSHAGDYTAVVTNVAGAVTSPPATLTILLPPSITSHPQSQTLPAGSAATFSVAATGATSYQWQKNNVNISGANASAYTISPVRTNDAGSYRAVVSNQGGSVNSNPAQLTVLAGGTNSSLVHWGQDLVFVNPAWVDLRPPAGLTNVLAIALGGSHGLALVRNGTVVGWGDNSFGQAAAPGLAGVKAIAAGLNHSIAMNNNGTVAAWGRNDFGQTNVTPGLTGVKAIAAGANHSLALRANGTIAGWGDNANGKASAYPTATNVIAIAAAADHSMALRTNGTVVAWGGNDDGQLATPLGLSNVIAIAAGDHHSLALRRDGTVVGWGAARSLYNYGQATPPAGLTNVMAIAAGGMHSLALLRDNTVVGWGADNYGQSAAPPGLGGVASLAAGPNRSLALVLPVLSVKPPVFLAGGAVRLEIGNRDGTPLAADRLPRIQLLTATNLAGAGAIWVILTNAFSPSGNGAIYQDLSAPSAAQKTYRVIEQP